MDGMHAYVRKAQAKQLEGKFNKFEGQASEFEGGGEQRGNCSLSSEAQRSISEEKDRDVA